MSIQSGDISLLESADTGSSGGAATASTITGGVQNNVFPDISDADRVSGIEIDRKVFFKNDNATDAAAQPSMYLAALPTNATLSIGFGVDDAADNDADQGNMVAWSANAQVALVSDGADSRIATVYGMDNSGTPVPITENVALNGATEVLSVNTYSEVWATVMDSTDSVRTVTVAQGTGGPERGMIPPDVISCWLWVVGPTSAAAGIILPDLIAGGTYGMWLRLVVAAAAGAVRPSTPQVSFEETA